MNAQQPSESSDWTRTPAALFTAAILGLCSISGLAWSLNRTMAHDSVQLSKVSVPDDNELQASSLIPSDSEIGSSLNSQAPEQSQLDVLHLIDLNVANAAELELLPRIGPALASRIIADREVHGWFNSIDELQRVSGIGPKTIEKIKAFAMITESNDSKPD